MDATGHDESKTALAPTDNSTVPATADHAITELEKNLGDLAASPQFVPLMGSFRDLLEAERRRNRMRTLLIGASVIIVLAVFIWGPLHMMRTYIRQSEERLAVERDSLQRVEHSLNDSMTVLADASRELRKTLESYRQTTPVGNAPSAAPAVQPSLPAPAVVAPVAPLVIVTPPPVRTNVTATTPPPVAVVTLTPPPPAHTGKVAVVASAPAASTNVPGTPQTAAPGVPPDVFRAATSTPAVPVAVAPGVPAATNRATSVASTTETRLNDVLADVERTIQAIKQKSAATNAAVTKKP